MTTARLIKQLKTLLRYLALLVALTFYMFPIYWLLVTAIKFPGDVVANPVIWLPKRVTLDNFRLLFGYQGPVWGEQEYTGRAFYSSVTPYLINSLINYY